MAAVWGDAILATEGHRVELVTSRRRERADSRALDLATRAGGYDELPGGADIVVVLTPPADHARRVLHAVGAGAGVIVEKPLCTTLADADTLVAAAQAGARIGYAENLLFSPLVREALQRIHALGPLTHLEVRALSRRPDWGGFLGADWGGGVLFDLGVHPLALAMAVLGGDAVTMVSCRLQGASDHDNDEWAEVWLTTTGGLRARLECSWREQQPVWDLQVATASSALRLELLPDPHLEQLGVDLPPPPRRAPLSAARLEDFGYLDQVAELGSELAAGDPPYLDMRFARAVLEVVCAAYASAGTGSPEPLPFRGRRDLTPRQLWLGATAAHRGGAG